MEYNKILMFALIPSVSLFFLSLVSLALTTHYWILTDWFIPRGVTVPTTNFNDRTQRYDTDATMVWYEDSNTDATIASACLNWTAAVVALIAWIMLRRSGMDSQYAAGERRFWILAVVVCTVSGAIAALASIILHYTERGDNQYGCTTETLMMGGGMNSNQYCTREMATCNFLPKFVKGSQRRLAAVACNETIVVKWFQIILIINAAVVFAMFAVQARIRRKTRDVREPKEPYSIVS